MTTASKYAKAAGLRSLAEVSKMTERSADTLTRWHKDMPDLFRAVIAGCIEIKRQERFNYGQIVREHALFIPLDHADDVVVYAFRYALGRKTFASLVMSETLIAMWENISAKTRLLIRREIEHAIDEGRAGQDCDVASWREVLALPLQ